LSIDTGVGRYLYPLEDGGTDDAGMSFWTTNAKVENTFSVNLELKSAYPIQDVRIPGFEAATQISELAEGHYKVEMQLTDMSLNRDFVFYYRLQDGLPGRVEVIPFRDNGSEPGSFMMVITPGVDLKPLTNGMDYCFVLDISGSMQSKMGTFKRGVMKAIEKLKPEDRFRLVTFSSNASELTRKWLPASDENRVKAQQMIDSLQSGGSTNLYAGLSLALDDLDDDRAANIILVTDAVTNTGVVNPVEFHKLLQKIDVRVFGFLLGNSANWPLMQTLAETTGGFYDSISNTDDIMGKLMQAGSKINYEALLNAEVKISGVNVSEITDDTFKKVYRGQQLILFGKYDNGGNARVTLKANLTGEDKTYATDFAFPDIDTDNPELERLWALAMIELGLEYQIVTDHTSMVVMSDTAFADRGLERRNQTRIAREQQARSQKAQQPAKNYTVDQQKPAFKFKTPNLGGGGGAIDPLTGGLAAVLTALGAIRLTIGRKKNRNNNLKHNR